MSVVVDASVAAKWLLKEADSDQAARLLGESLLAPSIIRLECANAILKRFKVGQLNEAEAWERLRQFALLPVQIIDVDETTAVDLAMKLSHPVYDCAYLALAVSQAVLCVTADERFVRAAERGGYGAYVRLLGDYLAWSTPTTDSL